MVHPTPELTHTAKIRCVLEDTQSVEGFDKELRERCKKALEQLDSCPTIPVKFLKEVYRNLKSSGKKVSLHELVEGADLVIKPVVLPPRDPELEVRVQRLRIEEENKEYRRMTQNVDPMQGNQKFSFQSEVKSMNRQLTSVINFLITVVAGFAFGYKIVEYTFGKMFPIVFRTWMPNVWLALWLSTFSLRVFGHPVVYGKLVFLQPCLKQMMAGLLVGTVIFFVDLYFMVRYTPV